jgi:cyclopropane-fatty-acyl-phospholipid synthase
MPPRALREVVQSILDVADVQIGGGRPWDLQVHDEAFYARVLRDKALGLGETYLEGWWDAARLDELFARLTRADLGAHVRRSRQTQLLLLRHRLFNRQRTSKAFEVGRRHYDLGNHLFEAMLDRRMVYSCAYWKGARTLGAAQEAKLALVCQKLGLEAGMRVLDVGCGWGSFAKYAAERHGVSVVGVNNSRAQTEWGRRACADLPVEIRLQDYRAVAGTYDRVVSIGMFEHVGPKNYRTFMEVAHRCLRDDGLFLLHTIGANTPRKVADPWVDKYIFPGGVVPAVTEVSKAIEGLFVLEDWHNFGAHYDQTLMAWFANFDRHWSALQQRYDERFYRMWTYYLLSFAGSFRSRSNQLWQLVLAKNGVPGGYASVR